MSRHTQLNPESADVPLSDEPSADRASGEREEAERLLEMLPVGSGHSPWTPLREALQASLAREREWERREGEARGGGVLWKREYVHLAEQYEKWRKGLLDELAEAQQREAALAGALREIEALPPGEILQARHIARTALKKAGK